MNKDQIKRLEQEIEHHKKMLEIHETRMRSLELQQAQFGIQAPTHVTTELDGLKRAIQEQKREIAQREGRLRAERNNQPKPDSKSNPSAPGPVPANTGGKPNPSAPRPVPANTGGKPNPSAPRPAPANTGGKPNPAAPANAGGKPNAPAPRPAPANAGGKSAQPPTSKPAIEEQIVNQLPNVLCIIYLEGYQNAGRVYVYGSVLGHHIEALIRDVNESKPIDIVKVHNFSVLEQGKGTPSEQAKQRIDENYLLDHKLTRVRLFPPSENNQFNLSTPNTTTQAGLFEQFRRNLVARFFRTDTSINSFQICRVSHVHIGMIAIFNPAAYAGNSDELYVTAKLAQQLAKLNTSNLTFFAVSRQGMGEDKIEAGESLVALLKRLFPRLPNT